MADKPKCTSKNPTECPPAVIKSRIVMHTAFVIIIGGLVTAFAFVFAQAILDLVNELIGETVPWINLTITAVLLLTVIVLLLMFQNKKKKWESIAESKGVTF